MVALQCGQDEEITRSSWSTSICSGPYQECCRYLPNLQAVEKTYRSSNSQHKNQQKDEWMRGDRFTLRYGHDIAAYAWWMHKVLNVKDYQRQTAWLHTWRNQRLDRSMGTSANYNVGPRRSSMRRTIINLGRTSKDQPIASGPRPECCHGWKTSSDIAKPHIENIRAMPNWRISSTQGHDHCHCSLC